MTIEKLDKKLLKVYNAGIDDNFVAFCNEHVNSYPVAPDLIGPMNEYFDRCEDSLITFCGGFAEKLGPLVDFANNMKKREIESGRWKDIYPEIGAAASLIAMRADETMTEGGMPQDNTNNLMLCMGLFTYAVIACNDCFKAQDYRHIFCLAWWIYFGKILSEPVDVEEHGKGLPS